MAAVFAEMLASPDDLAALGKLDPYLRAEFPGHLLIPEDLDGLCKTLMKYRPLVPPRFQDICLKEVWNDGLGSESLTFLSDPFVRALATFSDHEIQQSAWTWAGTFSYREPLAQTPVYRAVLQWRDVAQHAVTYQQSLLFYLLGAPGFFQYLRHL